MNAFHVIHISDTHLGRSVPECARNFDAVTDIVAARTPDLVVNTGDIAFNGADDEDDLGYARSRHARLPVPFRAVPGNHDVGDDPWKPDVEQRITMERLERYRRHFGPDYWRLEAGSWLLIGANAQLFGSGLTAEEEQWSFLATTAGEAGARPVALFLHKPLFDRHPGETDTGHRYVTPVHRQRLRETLRTAAVRLVASGHVHQHRRRHVGGVEYCWAPSTAFVIPDARQPRIGVKRLGYVEYAFRDHRVDVEVVEPSALVNHDLDTVWPPARQLNQSPSTTP